MRILLFKWITGNNGVIRNEYEDLHPHRAPGRYL